MNEKEHVYPEVYQWLFDWSIRCTKGEPTWTKLFALHEVQRLKKERHKADHYGD